MPTSTWSPPDHWTRITAIDAHTAGEPLRIFTSGLPDFPGATMLAKRRYAKGRWDRLRTATMWEPRGHADMYGAILTEPVTRDGHAGVLFVHNEGFSTMCGHGVIALAQVGVETGLLTGEPTLEDPSVLEIRLDTPAGRVTAFARQEEGQVVEVWFHNVPSFVYARDRRVTVDGLGMVRLDVAFGGAFYAFCRAEEVGVGLQPENFRELIDVGMRIKRSVMANLPIRHPVEPDLSFLYGTIFTGPARNPAHHSRNVCIFADGEVDRSPTGTGVSARAALHFARREIGLGEPFTVESILGTTFSGTVVETTTFAGQPAVIPQISGSAYICGRNELLIDPDDPLAYGFLLR
ncbi:MAG: proline racemase family protein [Caldilineaceae bacterium]|nr:proline racemase family protein [Caldilineaceae bacterium]HRJ42012.1 proline racemase family protein [Caldilineaceae bacterium]